ncbi:poly-gamma-glutamate hydrolase family protein [Virgisporangium aliadipatigenens]|uniref:poly-gamma-glutamate hydrolase family protein n=1 Tax=Virgisporangium aliadipatigenens TaxID=741659 RepID=UPI001943C2B8|nr:poly-gamma-glutamate hydrolase family protein [Virgisporangium aliadipatigenens]
MPRRRTLLTAAGGAAFVPVLPAVRASAADRYPSYTALYADPELVAGVDYGRRIRRHAASETGAWPSTVVLAPHGGGIEPGTSELCLAVAGYRPADLTPGGGAVHDHWMFEGLRSSGNAALHVTSTHCDDPQALSLCGGARRAVSLHGCSPTQAGLPEGTAAVLVGGRDAGLKQALLGAFGAAGFDARDAAAVPGLDGDDPANIVNRTLSGGGAQLELTTPLRGAMFTTNTRAGRPHTTTTTFWSFVAAVRAALP